MFRYPLSRILNPLLRKKKPFFPAASLKTQHYRFSTAQNANPDPQNPASKEPKPETKATDQSKPSESSENPQNTQNQSKPSESSENPQNAQKADEKSKETQTPPPEEKNFREKLKVSSPNLSKALEFGIYAWNLTFPKEKYRDKFEAVKARAREAKRLEQEQLNMSEEELAKMQDKIPDWKRTALVTKGEEPTKESLKAKVTNQFRNKFKETKFAKDLYTSDSYKEFQNFKKEMHQFKEDLKDYVENSPNAAVQTGLGIYSKASNESSTARAIKEMRKIDPTFDLYELEDDAKGIFEAAYTTYLQDNLELLEKMCGETALGYFKVLLRKMQAEKCEPKFKYLWQIDPAQFSTALVPDKGLPVFVFTIKTQEIYCNISKIDKRIVDGDEERLMNWEYQFAITPHQNPDLENVGHGWEIIELQPRQVVKMLV